MSGITHGWTTAQPDNPAYDVSADELNTHSITGDFDITGGASVPLAPAAGKVRQYVKVSGTTPNRNIRVGFLLEDGTDIVLADVTI
jgi:hypothetical protein